MNPNLIFEIPNLDESLEREDRGYFRNERYVCFSTHYKGDNDVFTSSRCLYLTFNGLLGVMYSSGVGCANKYRKWCNSVLFSIFWTSS